MSGSTSWFRPVIAASAVVPFGYYTEPNGLVNTNYRSCHLRGLLSREAAERFHAGDRERSDHGPGGHHHPCPAEGNERVRAPRVAEHGDDDGDADRVTGLQRRAIRRTRRR